VERAVVHPRFGASARAHQTPDGSTDSVPARFVRGVVGCVSTLVRVLDVLVNWKGVLRKACASLRHGKLVQEACVTFK
jgi:hypothetical protein